MERRPVQFSDYSLFRQSVESFSLRTEPILRRVSEMEWPTKGARIASSPTDETFLKLIGAIHKFQTIPRPNAARNTFSYCADLGRKLDDQMRPGDDEAAMYFSLGRSLLENINPQLAEDVDWVLVHAEGERRGRAQALYNKWENSRQS